MLPALSWDTTLPPGCQYFSASLPIARPSLKRLFVPPLFSQDMANLCYFRNLEVCDHRSPGHIRPTQLYRRGSLCVCHCDLL